MASWKDLFLASKMQELDSAIIWSCAVEPVTKLLDTVGKVMVR